MGIKVALKRRWPEIVLVLVAVIIIFLLIYTSPDCRYHRALRKIMAGEWKAADHLLYKVPRDSLPKNEWMHAYDLCQLLYCNSLDDLSSVAFIYPKIKDFEFWAAPKDFQRWFSVLVADLETRYPEALEYKQKMATPTPTPTPYRASTPRPTKRRRPVTARPADYDPYDAKDYTNAEDFYDDHYDDFFSYYEAEEYYEEHNK